MWAAICRCRSRSRPAPLSMTAPSCPYSTRTPAGTIVLLDRIFTSFASFESIAKSGSAGGESLKDQLALRGGRDTQPRSHALRPSGAGRAPDWANWCAPSKAWPTASGIGGSPPSAIRCRCQPSRSSPSSRSAGASKRPSRRLVNVSICHLSLRQSLPMSSLPRYQGPKSGLRETGDASLRLRMISGWGGCFWGEPGFGETERSLHCGPDDGKSGRSANPLDSGHWTPKQKMTGAHGVAPVIWKEGKEKSWEERCAVPFGSVRLPCRQQVMYQL